MRKILGFDTETTGLPDLNLSPDDAAQPWPVQIAARMVDEEQKLLHEINFIINPPIAIHPDAIKTHGITQERAAFCGFTPLTGVSMLLGMIAKADVIVGHNLDFDINITNLAKIRLGLYVGVDLFNGKEHFCTQKKSTDYIRMQPTDKMVMGGRENSYKPPRLREAYMFFFQREIENAHDAMADTKAALDIYFKIKELYVC